MAKKFRDKETEAAGESYASPVALDGDEDGREARARRAADYDEVASEAERPGRARRAAPVEPWTAADPRYQYLAAAILLVGAGLRLALLHIPPFMHDEAIHAMFAYNFGGYKYDPVYHGPLLYYLVAIVFALIGDYDFTARLIPALLGIGLMVMIIWPARRWLGDRAALWALIIVAISPSIVTYQRRLLHDALVLVLTLGSVLCFQVAREHASSTREGRLARLGLVALLSLFLCTKANAFFIIAMLFSFAVAMGLRRFWRARGRTPRWTFLLPVAMLFLVAFTSATAIRESANESSNETMFIIVCFLASLVVWEWLRRAPGEDDGARRVKGRGTASAGVAAATAPREPFWMRYDWQTPVLAFGVFMFILTFFYGNIYIWWREPGKIPQHLADTVGAIPGMISYWGGQQRAPRLASRHDYFIVLMLLYELPIVIAALGGIIRASRRRTPFTDLLLWWAFTSFTAYAMANEKVPWLLPHIILPFALLGGWWLAQLRPREPKRKMAFALGCALGAVFLIRGVSATNFERGLDHHEPMFFAHTTESFRDSFFTALRQNRERKDWLWIDGSYQWPMAWHLREPEKHYGAKVWWGVTPPNPATEGPMRMAVASESKYAGNPLFQDWHKWAYDPEQGRVVRDREAHPDLAVWPRASWGAIRLDRLPIYWLNREASVENGILYEDNHQPMVVASAP